VSAVATLFGLLLVVTFISNYILYVLPPQASQAEFQHVLQVENQVGALQATLNAQASKVGYPIPISSPITLGTAPIPPFGYAGTGSLTIQQGNPANGTAATSGVTLFQRSPTTQTAAWTTGTPAGGCFGTGSGSCSTCPGAGYYSYNIAASGTAVTPKSYTPAIAGGVGCPTFFNVSGSYDHVTLTLNFGSIGPVLLQVNGSHDQVTVVNAVSPARAELVSVNIYGTFNTYAFTNTAAGGAGGLTVNTRFIATSGTTILVCPAGAAATNDTLASFTLGPGANILQKLTWYNTTGTPNAYRLPQGGTNNTIVESWVVIPYTECPFTTLVTVPFQGLSTIVVGLQNYYIPSVQVALDGGAVVELQSAASSVMLVPPSWTFTSTAHGYALAMTLFQFSPVFTSGGGTNSAAPSAVSGTQTTILTTQVLWTNTTTIPFTTTNPVHTVPTSLSLVPVWFAVKTAFPAAWMQFLDTVNSHAFGSAALCLASAAVCESPPANTLVTVMARMTLVSLSITVATVSVTLG
jgi:hypothetical protein